MFDSKCVKCGKIAAVPPFCLACLLDMDEKEFIREKNKQIVIDAFASDEGDECTMCGKPNVYGGTDGMCSSCRQIWNG